MKWKEACLESDISVACRETKKHKYFRFLDGFSYCENKKSGVKRQARKSEIEGFSNWQQV